MICTNHTYLSIKKMDVFIVHTLKLYVWIWKRIQWDGFEKTKDWV